VVGSLIARGSDVHDHPEGEGGVLLDGALRAEGAGRTQLGFVGRARATVQQEQRLADSDEIADLVGELDGAPDALGLASQKSGA
jgi:hypothetical protein